MRKIALPLLFLALAITASAQTTSTLTEAVEAGRGTGTLFSAYQAAFRDGGSRQFARAAELLLSRAVRAVPDGGK